MKGKVVLVTGANGEMGHLLLPEITKQKPEKILTLDLHPLHPELKTYVHRSFLGSVSDRQIIRQIFIDHSIDVVIHLAAKLTTSCEKNPDLAFEANVVGTNNLLTQAAQSQKYVQFFFPSSISVYGLPNVEVKNETKIKETDHVNPATLYGVQKVYGEMLGKYYDKKGKVDFRCIRFPGLMSADTLPSCGTSDFAPEIVHHFAHHKNYSCYARAKSYLPFMAMPDAVSAILSLMTAPKENLTQHVYNIYATKASPEDIIEICKKHFEQDIDITYNIDALRQSILDTWPKETDDKKARVDWSWEPKYGGDEAFTKFLIPKII